MIIRFLSLLAAAWQVTACMVSPTDQQSLPDGPNTTISFVGFVPLASPTEPRVHIQALNWATSDYETVTSTTSSSERFSSEVVSGSEVSLYPYSTKSPLPSRYWRDIGANRLQATIRTQYVGSSGGVLTLASFVNDAPTAECLSEYLKMSKPVSAILHCATNKAAADIFTCGTPPCPASSSAVQSLAVAAPTL